MKRPLGASASGVVFPKAHVPVTTALSKIQPIGFQDIRQYSSTPSLEKDYPPHTLFPMPALSPTMETGTIANWTLKEGDSFAAGDILCSIETDKASVDFEAQDDGILAKILRTGPSAQDIAVGTPICVVIEDAGDLAAFADFVLPDFAPAVAASPATSVDAVMSTPMPAADPLQTRSVTDEFILLPSARHLSQSKGFDATGLNGSGKGGRVTKGDVMAALASGTHMPPLYAFPVSTETPAVTAAPAPLYSPAVTPAPALSIKDLVNLPLPTIESKGSFQDVPNNNMRKIIARRLTESKSQVPHYYTSMEIELDNVLALRKNLANNHGVKVSVNDLIIRSSALALRDVPEVNATYDPKTNQVSVQSSIDISVAVATPTGLITPIVPSTDRLGLADIADKVRDLAGRARDGKLQPHEYQGGTFCISNLGMFGIDEFSAVINPPQAAILAVGGGTARVVPTPWVDGAERQESPQIKTIMTARLSADRRVVDEATAGLFLSALRQYLTKPELLML